MAFKQENKFWVGVSPGVSPGEGGSSPIGFHRVFPRWAAVLPLTFPLGFPQRRNPAKLDWISAGVSPGISPRGGFLQEFPPVGDGFVPLGEDMFPTGSPGGARKCLERVSSVSRACRERVASESHNPAPPIQAFYRALELQFLCYTLRVTDRHTDRQNPVCLSVCLSVARSVQHRNCSSGAL